MVDERTILGGMMASCLAFSPDGALFVGDWDGLWNPDNKGSIWVLDDPQATGSPARREVRELLRNPWSAHTTDALTRLLGHADQRIRMRSQFELVRRGSATVLLQVARDSQASPLARIHALWGLGQARTPLKARDLPLADAEPRVRAQAAKVAGDLRVKDAAASLIARLRDDHLRVRFQAAIALGKIGDPSAFDALVTLIDENRDQDPFLRHAATMGLSGLGDPKRLARLRRHPSISVRVGAVVALRRLASPLLAEFLDDPAARVRREAAMAIHDDLSVPQALPALARLLETTGVDANRFDEAVMRRALSANLRLGTPESARRLIDFAQRTSAPEPLRIEALESLASWNASPFLDRVEGRVRTLSSRPNDLGHRLIAETIVPLWSKATPALRQTLARLVVEHRIAAPSSLLADGVRSGDQPVGVRIQALRSLAQTRAPELAECLALLMGASEVALREAALEVQARQSPAKFLEYVQARSGSAPLRDQQMFLRLLADQSEVDATTLLNRSFDRLVSGELPQPLVLDVLEAARKHRNSNLAGRARDWESTHPEAWRKSLLAGGDPEVGRRVFQGSVQGQCGRCHNAGGEGQQAGPVLQGIGQRATPEHLLESLLEPSARITDGYATLRLTLKNGESLDGILLGETDGRLRMRLSSGEQRTVSVSDIASRSQDTQSVMPPMGGILSPRELRDLVAFLSAWK
jgi:putative heme-binding domain-containing protein